eukprot:UN16888
MMLMTAQRGSIIKLFKHHVNYESTFYFLVIFYYFAQYGNIPIYD